MTESINTKIVALLKQAGLPSEPWEVVGKTFHFVCQEEGYGEHNLCGTITGVVIRGPGIAARLGVDLQVSLTQGPGGWPVDSLKYFLPGERELHELFEGEKISPDQEVEEHVRNGGWMLRTKDGRGENGGPYGRWRGYLYLH